MVSPNDGDAVQCWRDLSGNNNHQEQSNVADAPTYDEKAQYGNAGLVFNNSHSLSGTISSGYSGNQAATMILVARPEINGSDQYMLSTGKAVNNRSLSIGTGNSGFIDRDFVNFGANYINTAERITRYNEVQVYGVTYDGSAIDTSGSLSFYINGVAQSFSLVGFGSLNLANDVTIGSSWSGVKHAKGKIMEILVYNRKLQDSEREAIENYLRAKWQKGVDGIAGDGLVMHYDAMKANSMTASACSFDINNPAATGVIGCWKDRSTMNKDLYAGASPSVSSLGFNGNKSVYFDGFGDHFTASQNYGIPNGNNRHSSFTAFELDDHTTGNRQIWKAGPLTTNRMIGLSRDQSQNRFGFLSNDYAWTGSSSGAEMISTSYSGGSHNTDQLIFQNGLTPSSFDESGTSDPLDFSYGPIYVGSLDASSNYFDGHIGELALYAREMSESESVENSRYLADKWGDNSDNTKAPGGVDYGLALWLDASDTETLFQDTCATAAVKVTGDGQDIHCWQDKSGRGNHVTEDGVAAATYQTNSINGRSALNFAMDGYTGTLPEFSGGSQEHTIFLVADSDGAGGSYLSIGNDDSNNQLIHLHSQTSELFRYSFWGPSIDQTIPAMEDTSHIYTVSYDGAKGSLWHNGDFLWHQTMTLNLAANPEIGIGYQSVSSGFNINSKIAEIVIYNRKLSDHERQSVEAYLAQKWLYDVHYRDCFHADISGETESGNYLMDPDGYNGPAPLELTYCDLPTFIIN